MASTAPTRPELIDRFAEWASKAGATVERVADGEPAKAAVLALADRIGATRVTATPEGARFAPPGALVGGSAAQVADADLAVSVAHLAVAETGSVLLGSNATEDRLAGMLAHTHALIVPGGRLVRTLDDAAGEIRRLTAPGEGQLRYVSFVTGPSRTADIERVLTIGVQGPRAVHVILIEGD